MLFGMLTISIWLYCCTAIIEPYPSLNGGSWQNNSYLSSVSFDPVINYVWDLNSINSSALQIYNVTAKYAYTDHEGSFLNLESIYLTPNNVNVIVYGPGNITIDFGQENAGWLEIDSNDCTDNGLLLSISEYNQPGYTGNPKYPKTLPPVKYVNNGVTTYRLETNQQLYDGVRYGFIHVSNQTSKPWHITGIRTVSQIKPNNYVGSFQSKQYQMLNYIWYTAAFCVKMNMLPDGFGAILMDRGDRYAWIGDNHISQRVAMNAFGSFDYVKQVIINTQNNSNGILSYALYWVESVYDYYMMTNDTMLLKEVEAQIVYYLNQSISGFGTNPKITFYGWDERLGAGFEEANVNREAQYAYQMLTIQTIGKSLIFFDKNALNDMDLYNYYSSKRTEFIVTIRSDSNYLNKFGLHSSADGINGLWMNKSETDYLLSKWFNDSVNICSWSPFNMFFITTAIGNIDEMDYLLSALDFCWGNQIRLGATTFWEMYSPHWNDFLAANDPIPSTFGMTSECHPWSSGALSIINQFITGIQIIKPGFEYVQIKPALTQIKAEVPINQNQETIIIDFDAYVGKYMINIPIPMTLDIYFPVISVAYHVINNDNIQIDTDRINVIESKHQKYLMIHFEHGELKTNRNYYFQIPLSNANKIAAIKSDIPNVFPPPYYPCSVVNKDFETKGNWINKYGKDGYILYAYKSTKNLIKLPTWVKSVDKVDNSALCDWISNTSDVRALQDPSHPNERALGSIYSTGQSFALNIDINGSMTYYMSLYLCDWDYNNRKQTIHIYDASNFNFITPIVYNEDYVDGVWITYKLDRSVRIRIDFVRGTNAVLSGMFFDTNLP